ncbi:hypothetical protein AB0K12_24965 [Nonomuraea sp. NPDC049419]|uniref:hypothetical protein n=1 Tax=Nonomuraea sp. NPDC049419 TaxID=3155772 RepID=UPI00342E65DF
MPRVLSAIGPESLGELLTEIALEHWPAAAIGDVLPALHVLDPEEADEPAVAIALDRAGSWAGLLALTSRELVDQPFIQARPVLNTLFSAVLVRLAPARPVADEAGEPAAPASVPAVAPLPVPDVESPAPEAAEGPERVLDADDEPVIDAAPEPEPEPEPVLDAADEPAPEPAAEEAEALEEARAESPAEEAAPDAEASDVEAAHEAEASDVEAAHEAEAVAEEEPALDAEPAPEAGAVADASDAEAAHQAEALPEHEETDGEPEVPSSVEPGSEAAAAGHAGYEFTPEDEHADEHADDHDEDEQGGEQGRPGGQELPQLIEAAFAGLDDKSWAVAQNRVFTDEPSAVDQLAKLFAVPPAEIVSTEMELRARLDRWLASDDAAPYRAHLDELVRTLGPDAPKEQVVGAADWHQVEIQALEVPAWQVVLTTLAPPPPPPPPAPEPEPEPPAEPLPRRKGPRQQQPYPQPPVELVQSAFGPVHMTPAPPPGPPQFQAFTPVVQPAGEANGGEADQPYQPLKDVSQTRRCFRQPDGRWWLRIDVTAEQMAGGECALPTGFASYLGLSPGESRTVRSAAGELAMTWHGRPLLESIERLLVDVGAREGGHLFLTLSDEGVLRARHLPVAAQGAEKITKALRLVGYTAPGGTKEQAARVIATRIGMPGPVALPDLLDRLRERGDRDLLELLD